MTTTEVKSLPTAARVRRLIADRKAGPAVKLAKETFERLRTAEADELYLEASFARVRELMSLGSWTKAQVALAELARHWPEASEQVAEYEKRLTIRGGQLDSLVVQLQDTSLSSEDRARLDAMLRQDLIDPAILADCEALPQDHVLRRDAQMIRAAFIAVTTGPIARDALILPTLSRRSPLAPWKLLIQALACYYRQEDAESERLLAAIDPQSAPAKLVPVLQAAMHDKQLSGGPVSTALAKQIIGNQVALRTVLAPLDAAFATGKRSEVLRAIGVAVEQCRSSYPAVLEPLLQVLTVRWIVNAPKLTELQHVLGTPAKKDANFWRLLALASEEESPPFGCLLWAEFRLHALHQGLFEEQSEIAAALFVHMASLLEAVPFDELLELRKTVKGEFSSFRALYADQSAAILKVVRSKSRQNDLPADWALRPEILYQRAMQIDPHSAGFAAWLAWAKKQEQPALFAEAAEAWHTALPNDLAPVLVLARQAEERNALQKALKYLDEAERLNPLNQEVRQLRLRLHLRNLRRHAKLNNERLVRGDLDTLRALPILSHRDGATLLAAIEWVWAFAQNPTATHHGLENVEQFLNPLVIPLLLEAIGVALFNLKRSQMKVALPTISPDRIKQEEHFLALIAHVCTLGEMLEIPLELPGTWHVLLQEMLIERGTQLSVNQLEILGRLAYAQTWFSLGSLIADVGFKLGGSADAYSLLLRGQTLPHSQRRLNCFIAAAALARRSRDTKVLHAAIELSQQDLHASPFLSTKALNSLSPAELEAILETERNGYKPIALERKFERKKASQPKNRTYSRQSQKPSDYETEMNTTSDVAAKHGEV